MKKFYRFLLIGFSSIVLLIAGQQGLFDRGNQIVGAQWDASSTTFFESEERPFAAAPGGDGSSTTFFESAERPFTSSESQPTQPQPPSITTQPTPSCDFEFKYPECDNTAAGWSHEVWQNCRGEFQIRNAHFQGGVCGDTPSQPAPSCTWNRDQFGECDWATHTVWDVEVNSCNGARRRTSIARTNAPECGFVVQQPQQQQEVRKAGEGEFCGGNIQCEGHLFCPGEDQSRQLGIPKDRCTRPIIQQPVQPQPAQGAPQQAVAAVVNSGNSEVRNSGNSNVNIVNDNRPVQNLTINNPQPATVRYADVAVCPEGYTRRVDRNIVTCIAAAPRIVMAAAGYESKELPKTGLPALFWAAVAFLPVGAGMQRFKKGFKANWSNPNYIWEKRQFEV